MKISTLQELVDWLIDLDPSGSICWPCMLPYYEMYLYENKKTKEVRAIKIIQGLGEKDEEPRDTLKRLLTQFILIDLKIEAKNFEKGFPLKIEKGSITFSWKAFSHWIINQLEEITSEKVSLPQNWRSAVDKMKKRE